ncbi:hypothetical protein AURDEDRAFT_165840 [Auricularia subglabra TFB-10046 SS5]|nr:hypothetical protein AURDEDRAFT_165840 [Auricularia subglabra TFB-10046 SS5]
MDDLIDFYSGFERALFDSLVEVADADVVKRDTACRSLAYMASSLHALLRLNEAELHPVIAAYRETVSPLSPPILHQPYTPGHFVGLLLGQWAKLRIGIATGPGDAWKLQACARCHFMRYCSRECQRADWRDDADGRRASHKALCPILCKLWGAGASIEKQTTKEFAVSFDAAGIEPCEFRVLHLWASASGVVPEKLRAILFGSLDDSLLGAD